MEELALFTDDMPEPSPAMAPTAYADELGQWFVRQTAPSERKTRGQYFTPVDIAHFMARMCGLGRRQESTLDVGAGAGMLSCALVEVAAQLPNVR